MEKKKEIIQNQHQIDLLKKYFPVDEEKHIVTVKIYYDKVTDMLDFSVGEEHMEMMSQEVLEKITKITDKIPRDYKVDILFIVDDFCGYDPKTILEKLGDLVEINSYQVIGEKKKNRILAAILLLVGFILLFFVATEKQFNWISEGLKKGVIEEMLDITSWVFIWEAVTILFLSPSDLFITGVKFITKINKIGLFNKDEKLIDMETKTSILDNFKLESGFQKFKKVALLVTSTILLGMGIYSTGTNLSSLIISDHTQSLIILYSFSLFIDSIILCTGLLGMLYYRGNNKLKKILNFLAILLFLGLIALLVTLIQYQMYEELVKNFVIIFIEGLFIYSTLFINNTKEI